MTQTSNRLRFFRTASAMATAAAIALSAPFSQAQVLGGAPYAPGPDPVMERLQSRVQALETQVRSATGQMESLAFQLTEAKRTAEAAQAGKAAADQQIAALTARINSLERFARGETPTLEAAPAAAYSSVAPAPAPAPVPGQIDTRPTTFPANPSGVASGSPAGPSSPANVGLQSAPVPLTPGGSSTVAAATTPAGVDEGAQMNAARNLLLNGDFPGAQKAFTAFLDQHPKSPEAANAQYLLAESLLYQEAYSEAATAYGKVLSAYPKSEHGPESLVKLARSMRLMGKKSEACKALQLLPTNYPTAPATVKTLAAAEKSRAGC